LGDLLRRSAARYRDKTAIIDGSTSLTFTEFDAMVDRVAAGLARGGVQPGDRVALLSRNSAAFAALAWGCARLGAVLVPINFMLNAAEIAFILVNAEATVFAAQAEFREQVGRALETSPSVRLTISMDGDPEGGGPDFEELAATEVGDWEPPVVDDDAPIRLMYTSGTESRPKGAILTSRALQAEYLSAVVDGGMTGDDIDLHTLPLYHCAQLDCFLGPDLMLGATSVILPAP